MIGRVKRVVVRGVIRVIGVIMEEIRIGRLSRSCHIRHKYIHIYIHMLRSKHIYISRYTQH